MLWSNHRSWSADGGLFGPRSGIWSVFGQAKGVGRHKGEFGQLVQFGLVQNLVNLV